MNVIDSQKAFFQSSIGEADPLIAVALSAELNRQQNQIELIASENIVSRAVLDALGHAMTNKTLEGYPGKRFHGGGKYVDIVEQAAIDRAKQLFGCEYVNCQPHSGTQANQAVFFALLKPGDSVLSMDLSAGGHLSHGASPNLSGRWFDAHHYGVDAETGTIDYESLENIAKRVQPKLIIAGGSAYPRQIDFERISNVAKNVGAVFLADMAHIAGLVAAGVHPSPVPHADIVTCTTTKTMRGPRGGLILCRDKELGKNFQSAIFPGVQGSLHTQVIAAKAVCLGEALTDDFRYYGQAVLNNARTLGETLKQNGVRLVSDGTDTHMILLNLENSGMSGQMLQNALDIVNITSNKNPIPFDSKRPSEWKGVRLGVAAATSRGLQERDFVSLGEVISNIVKQHNELTVEQSTKYCQIIARLCAEHPIYDC